MIAIRSIKKIKQKHNAFHKQNPNTSGSIKFTCLALRKIYNIICDKTTNTLKNLLL